MTKATIAARTQRFARSIAAIPLALCAPGALAVQLLINPGFETGGYDWWTFSGNSPSFGVAVDGTAIEGADSSFLPNFVNVRSGFFAGYALVSSDDFDFRDGIINRLILTQTIGVVPDSSYSVGFFLGVDSPIGFGTFTDDVHLQIFINGAGLLTGPIINVPHGNAAADFVEFASTFDSGFNTSVTVAFAINGSGFAPVNASFDDFYVEGPAPAATRRVAEPATLALLALGLTGLGLIRRKANPLTRLHSPKRRA